MEDNKNNREIVKAQNAEIGHRFTKTELFSILKDALQGDPEALKNPALANIPLNAVKDAIDWLTKSGGLDSKTTALLTNESWRLIYHRPFITPEQFLTPEFIGDQAKTLWPPVRKAFLEFMDPTMPYRNLVLSTSIGWGKAQPLYAKVKYPKGEKPMSNVMLGDEVSTPSGTAKVAGIVDWPEDEVYEIELEDGRKHQVGINHLNHVSYRQENGKDVWEDVETRFILEHPEYHFKFLVND